jgi:hypothetical protein
MQPSRVLLLLAPVAVSLAVFAPITENYFHADDFLVLYGIVNRSFMFFVMAPVAGHVLVARNLLFYGMYELFGPSPEPFFFVALATHTLNVWLLFRVIRAFTDSAWLACFGALLWGASPVNEAVLGWYTCYGHVMATTVVLLVLGQLGGRLRDADAPPAAVVWRWFLLLIVASTCFGTGLAAAMVFPAVVLLCLPQLRLQPRRMLPLLTLPLVIAMLYFAVHALWQYGFDGDMGGVVQLTRHLAYWRPAARLTLQLFAAGFTGLLASFAQRPPAYPGPLAPLLSALAVVVVLVAWWRSDAQGRRYLLAFTVLAAGGYGMVAAGRAFGAVTVLGQSVAVSAGTPRYHYLVTAVLSALLCVALGRVSSVQLAAWSRATVLASVMAAGALLYVEHAPPIDHHLSARRETEGVLAAVLAGVGTRPPGEPVYIENHPFASVALYMGRFQLPFPGWAAIFLIFHPSGVLERRRVYFVSRDPQIVAAESAAVRPIVVAPEAVPAGIHPL